MAKMKRFRVEYGDPFEFEADSWDGIVAQLRARHRMPGRDEESFRRRLAMELVEWGGGIVYFSTNSKLARSMHELGYLVELPVE